MRRAISFPDNSSNPFNALIAPLSGGNYHEGSYWGGEHLWERSYQGAALT